MADLPASGHVLWITGLSGAGKSSIARAVVQQLRSSGQAAVLLDGDAVRLAVADPHVGHDRESRLVNAWRICRLAHMLAEQGLIVVVATMSLYREIHTWNRAHLPGYFEVLVKVSLDTLHARDARGLYSRARNGQAANVAGVDLEYDEPERPDLILPNDAPVENFSALARQLLLHLHHFSPPDPQEG